MADATHADPDHAHADTAHAGLSLVACALWIALPASVLAAVLWLATHGPLPVAVSRDWVPALGVSFAFRIDGLSLMMLLLISGIGVAVFSYAGAYMAGDPKQVRLYGLLTAFMLAMAGAVTADDVILLFLFWEATSILSFLLVGLKHDKPEARKSAQQALLVTGTGGLALLAGLLILVQQFGTTQLSAIVAGMADSGPTPLSNAALLLIFVGCFTKSAQFPFHFWLPNAMAAPTPVSAYLHSATMVKLGVFLLARFDAGAGEWPLWTMLLQAVGSITAAWGMTLALSERDLKRILAWSTVATLGTLVVLVGLPGPEASLAVGSLLLAHALYKAPLFFVAGNVDHGAGTRIIDNLGNLRRSMPLTAVAAALAGLSMAGLPLSFGYVVKVVTYEAKAVEGVLTWVPLANQIFTALAVAVAGTAAIRLFWWNPGGVEAPAAHECSWGMVLPPLVVAGAGLVLGFYPGIVTELLLGVAGAMETTRPGVVALPTPAEQLNPADIWGTVGATLLAGGFILYFWDFLHRVLMRPFAVVARMGARAFFDASLAALPRIAARVTRGLQHGNGPRYMMLAVVATLAALAAVLPRALADVALPVWEAPSAGLATGVAMIVAGAVAVLLLRDRFVLILAAGLVGYGSAVVFLFLGAPDVAFTQFVVETVFVIIAAAVLIALRGGGKAQVHADRSMPVALLLAGALASAVTALLVAVIARPFDPVLSDYFGSVSVPEAFGRNVVNVILVDFRAVDTLGEITVIALSFMAALPLLQRLMASTADIATQAGGRRVVMLDVVAGPLYRVILIASIVVYFRGHNEPGGGFIGGLLAVTATILWAIAHGSRAAEARLPFGNALVLTAAGFGLGAAAGLPAWLYGLPYMTHLWATIPLGITDLKVSTVYLFDLGVYLAVWGGLGGYVLHLLGRMRQDDREGSVT
jgi:multicomponent Na+:H+ antiporter subunit A